MRWVALLPLLDPTVMGWKGRAFFLGGHAPQLFDYPSPAMRSGGDR